eukprot:TRINITY_DN6030_c0_g1_i1.p1 TRINITY_DN6030_c0_g1~~TRINITY_DN6030_c0_g1_i1.p1  ORF type:complete len:519 (-),score=172.03 TRINITY_DN6030_c0_g1_i1:203-1690(-)
MPKRKLASPQVSPIKPVASEDDWDKELEELIKGPPLIKLDSNAPKKVIGSSLFSIDKLLEQKRLKEEELARNPPEEFSMSQDSDLNASQDISDQIDKEKLENMMNMTDELVSDDLSCLENSFPHFKRENIPKPSFDDEDPPQSETRSQQVKLQNIVKAASKDKRKRDRLLTSNICLYFPGKIEVPTTTMKYFFQIMCFGNDVEAGHSYRFLVERLDQGLNEEWIPNWEQFSSAIDKYGFSFDSKVTMDLINFKDRSNIQLFPSLNLVLLIDYMSQVILKWENRFTSEVVINLILTIYRMGIDQRMFSQRARLSNRLTNLLSYFDQEEWDSEALFIICQKTSNSVANFRQNFHQILLMTYSVVNSRSKQLQRDLAYFFLSSVFHKSLTRKYKEKDRMKELIKFTLKTKKMSQGEEYSKVRTILLLIDLCSEHETGQPAMGELLNALDDANKSIREIAGYNQLISDLKSQLITTKTKIQVLNPQLRNKAIQSYFKSK